MPNLIGITEAARILGISRQAVYKMVERGDLDFYKDSTGHYRFNEVEVRGLAGMRAKKNLNRERGLL